MLSSWYHDLFFPQFPANLVRTTVPCAPGGTRLAKDFLNFTRKNAFAHAVARRTSIFLYEGAAAEADVGLRGTARMRGRDAQNCADCSTIIVEEVLECVL